MAQAFVLALDGCQVGKWRAYNVGSGIKTSVTDIVEIAEQITGRGLEARHVTALDGPVAAQERTR